MFMLMETHSMRLTQITNQKHGVFGNSLSAYINKVEGEVECIGVCVKWGLRHVGFLLSTDISTYLIEVWTKFYVNKNLLIKKSMKQHGL